MRHSHLIRTFGVSDEKGESSFRLALQRIYQSGHFSPRLRVAAGDTAFHHHPLCAGPYMRVVYLLVKMFTRGQAVWFYDQAS